MCTIGVYIVTYNRVDLLRSAVSSVFCQDFLPDEIIIVDDNSTDGTKNFIDDLRSDNIKLVKIRNETNIGPAASRNIAIKSSESDYITGLDDDDFFYSTRISDFVKKKNELNRLQFSFLFSNQVIGDGFRERFCVRPSAVGYNMMHKRNYVGNQIFIERKRLLEVGLFNESLRALEDYELYVRLIKKYGVAINCGSATYYWRQIEGIKRVSNASDKNISEAVEFIASNFDSFSAKSSVRLAAYDYKNKAIDARFFYSALFSKRLYAALKIIIKKLLR